MPSIIIRIRQKGYIRSAGYQAVNWAVTVPVSDPPGDPLLGTQPLSYAPLFVVRNSGGADSLARVATLRDLVAIPQAELKYFDILGPGGDQVLSTAQAGDVLTFPETSGRLSYWLEDTAPYNSNQFTVAQLVNKAAGSGPQILSSSRLQLPGYSFTDNDVNRWVRLSGFSSPAYNALVQIQSISGNIATINIPTPTSATGGAWQMPLLEIVTNAGAGLEPRFFPTRETNLQWTLTRGAVLVGSGAYGGTTTRWAGPPSPLARSIRYTELAPSSEAANAFFVSVRSGVAVLQTTATKNDTDFTPLLTSTYGP